MFLEDSKETAWKGIAARGWGRHGQGYIETHQRKKLTEFAKEQDFGVFFSLYFGTVVN